MLRLYVFFFYDLMAETMIKVSFRQACIEMIKLLVIGIVETLHATSLNSQFVKTQSILIHAHQKDNDQSQNLSLYNVGLIKNTNFV